MRCLIPTQEASVVTTQFLDADARLGISRERRIDFSQTLKFVNPPFVPAVEHPAGLTDTARNCPRLLLPYFIRLVVLRWPSYNWLATIFVFRILLENDQCSDPCR